MSTLFEFKEYRNFIVQPQIKDEQVGAWIR